MAIVHHFGVIHNNALRLVLEYFQLRLPDDFWLINGLTLVAPGKNTIEYELIILSPYGIYVVEVRDVPSDIVGDKETWQLLLAQVVVIQSPIRIAQNKAWTLIDFLKRFDISLTTQIVNPAVVLLKQPENLNIQDTSYPIVYPKDMFLDHLLSLGASAQTLVPINVCQKILDVLIHETGLGKITPQRRLLQNAVARKIAKQNGVGPDEIKKILVEELEVHDGIDNNDLSIEVSVFDFLTDTMEPYSQIFSSLEKIEDYSLASREHTSFPSWFIDLLGSISQPAGRTLFLNCGMTSLVPRFLDHMNADHDPDFLCLDDAIENVRFLRLLLALRNTGDELSKIREKVRFLSSLEEFLQTRDQTSDFGFTSIVVNLYALSEQDTERVEDFSKFLSILLTQSLKLDGQILLLGDERLLAAENFRNVRDTLRRMLHLKAIVDLSYDAKRLKPVEVLPFSSLVILSRNRQPRIHNRTYILAPFFHGAQGNFAFIAQSLKKLLIEKQPLSDTLVSCQTDDLVDRWDAKYYSPNRRDLLHQLAQNIGSARLGDIMQVLQQGSPLILDTSVENDPAFEIVPLIKASDISGVSLSNRVELAQIAADCLETAVRVKEGDLLLTVDLNQARSCLPVPELDGALCSPDVFIMRMKRTWSSPELLLQSLRSSACYEQLCYLQRSIFKMSLTPEDICDIILIPHPVPKNIPQTTISPQYSVEEYNALIDLRTNTQSIPSGQASTFSLVLQVNASFPPEALELTVNSSKGVISPSSNWKMDLIQPQIAYNFDFSIYVPGTWPFLLLSCEVDYVIMGKRAKKIFQFTIEILSTKDAIYRPIPKNPYIPGKAIPNLKMFFGRKDVLEFIHANLFGQFQSNVLILHGNHRIGKTSILQHLMNSENAGLLGQAVPVMLDVQGTGTTLSDYRLFYLLLKKMRSSILKEIHVDLSSENSLNVDDPFNSFLEIYEEYVTKIENRRVVFLFDEFDQIVDGVANKLLGSRIPDCLRNLFQHSPNLGVIITGSSRLNRYNTNYFSSLFGIGLKREISSLDEQSARELITLPVEKHVDYSEAAIQTIFALTGNHPYFLQMLCFEIVNLLMTEKKSNTVTPELARNAGITVLANIDDPLKMVGNDISSIQRAMTIFFAYALNLEQVQELSLFDLEKIGKKHHVRLGMVKLENVLRELVSMDVMQTKGDLEHRMYSFKIGLVRAWFQSYSDLQTALNVLQISKEELE